MSDRGWICPKCEAVHAPSVLTCSCPVKVTTTPATVDWTWFQQAARCPLTHYPPPYWYGVQPAPRITYDTVTVGSDDSLKVRYL